VNTASYCGWLTFSTRAVIQLASFEATRILSFYIMIILMTTTTFQKFVECMLSPDIGTSQVLKYYKVARVIYNIIKPIIEEFLSVLMSAFFWTIVLGICIIIKFEGKVAFIMYALVCMFTLFISGAMFSMLRVVSQFGENCSSVVTACDAKARMEHVRRKRKETKIVKLETKALQAIKIMYGSFMTVDTALLANMVDNLVARVFDCLLIF